MASASAEPVVRPAQVADAAGVHACKPHHPLAVIQVALAQAILASGPRRWCQLVADDGGEVIGTVAVIRHGAHFLADLSVWMPADGDDVASVEDLFVREDRRNAGVARRLVAAAVDEAASWGVRQVRAYTTNPAAERAFRAAGMRSWGTVAAREGLEYHFVVDFDDATAADEGAEAGAAAGQRFRGTQRFRSTQQLPRRDRHVAVPAGCPAVSQGAARRQRRRRAPQRSFPRERLARVTRRIRPAPRGNGARSVRR